MAIPNSYWNDINNDYGYPGQSMSRAEYEQRMAKAKYEQALMEHQRGLMPPPPEPAKPAKPNKPSHLNPKLLLSKGAK